VPRQVLEADRDGARRRFGIGAEERCLAVFGGSQGAHTVNLAAFEGLIDERRYRVLHVSGRRDYPELEQRHRRAGSPEHYLLVPWESHLGEVLAACDLVVARAGGSVFEIAAAGRPSILVPYPHATADHQSANARWLAAGGAATVIPDAQLSPERLRAIAEQLLDDPGRLVEMSRAARGLARPDAADRIAGEVLAAVAA
jgi:UDP-N-acetylglucosamine--N-acetylmuramyl-(pentapeptide) pyrophosphoryl-undecaprenol N-acetylglucosamine transferase